MNDPDVTAFILAHHEGMLAKASILSALEAAEYARDRGVTVKCIAILDNADSETESVFSSNGAGWLDIHHVSYGDAGLARNYAAKLANSKYICNLDGDDLWSFNWIYLAWMAAESSRVDAIYHPRLNFYFNQAHYIFRHISSTEREFNPETLAFSNYWTSLCFCKVETLRNIPYPASSITSGIGYEDWWWNMETVSRSIPHIAIDDTVHFIRRRNKSVSRASLSNNNVTPPSRYFVDHALKRMLK